MVFIDTLPFSGFCLVALFLFVCFVKSDSHKINKLGNSHGKKNYPGRDSHSPTSFSTHEWERQWNLLNTDPGLRRAYLKKKTLCLTACQDSPMSSRSKSWSKNSTTIPSKFMEWETEAVGTPNIPTTVAGSGFKRAQLMPPCESGRRAVLSAPSVHLALKMWI